MEFVNHKILMIVTISVLCVVVVHYLFPQSFAITISTNSSTPSVFNYTILQHNFTQYVLLSHSQLIGVQLAQSCITQLQHNTSFGCISYDKLRVFDNTNPYLAGQWVTKPYYHRLNPLISNFYQFGSKNFTVMVDPSSSFTAMARMIIVQPGHFTYISPDDIMVNNTRIEYQDRFVGGCELAIVAPNIGLINDTIQYLENGCTKTKYVTKFSIYMGDKPADITKTNWYVYNQYLKAAKSITNDCIRKHCNSPKDAFSNW